MNDKFLRAPRYNAFTLLEIMAVMLIIAILAAAIFPAAAKLRANAVRRKAEAEAACLAQALCAFRLAVGSWPCQTQGASDTTWTNNSHIIQALRSNPLNRVFFERPTQQTEGSDTSEFRDPWNRLYMMIMDENGDGSVSINVVHEGYSISTNIRTPAAVVSWGPNPADPRSHIFSYTP